ETARRPPWTHASRPPVRQSPVSSIRIMATRRRTSGLPRRLQPKARPAAARPPPPPAREAPPPPPPVTPRGPLTTALKPTGLNAFYIEYQGRRWFANGPAVLLDPAKLTRSGEYHGFPVYVGAGAPASETIYVAVASSTTGLVTPYAARK